MPVSNPYKRQRQDLAQRLKRVERKQALNKPEIKKSIFPFRPTGTIPSNGEAYVDLTSGIVQGTGTQNRIGTEVKVTKIHIRGDAIGQWKGNNSLVDVYFIELHDENSVPQFSDYNNAVGGFMNLVAGKVWRHQTINYGSGDASIFDWVINILFGRTVVWDGAATQKPVKGNLYLHLINRSSTTMADGDINLSYEVQFIDK